MPFPQRCAVVSFLPEGFRGPARPRQTRRASMDGNGFQHRAPPESAMERVELSDPDALPRVRVPRPSRRRVSTQPAGSPSARTTTEAISFCGKPTLAARRHDVDDQVSGRHTTDVVRPTEPCDVGDSLLRPSDDADESPWGATGVGIAGDGDTRGQQHLEWGSTMSATQDKSGACRGRGLQRARAARVRRGAR